MTERASIIDALHSLSAKYNSSHGLRIVGENIIVVGVSGAPGVPPGTPAWWDSGTSEIHLNLSAIYSGQDIARKIHSLNALHPDHRIPTDLSGFLTHEGAHSRWSGWLTGALRAEKSKSVRQVMELFEEIRIEYSATAEYGNVAADRLRGSFLWLLHKLNDDGGLDADDPMSVARAWLLIVGRRRAGVALAEEVDSFDRLARTILSEEVVNLMEDILGEAVSSRSPESDVASCARQWLDLINPGWDDEVAAASYGTLMHGSGSDESSADGASESIMRSLIEEVITTIEERPDIGSRVSLSDSRTVAAHVFGRGPTSEARMSTPSGELRLRAQRLSRTFELLSLPSVTLSHVPSEVPPGRMRGREAVRQSAERSLGLMSTATPWQRAKRIRSHTKPVIIGTMVDVSGSMGWAEDFVAEFAWAVGTAAVRIGARTAAVAFGDNAYSITRPGEPPRQVVTYPAVGGSESFDLAAAAIDGVLHLSAKNNASKVVFVITDGELVNPGEPERARMWLARFNAAGTFVVGVNIRPGRWEAMAPKNNAVNIVVSRSTAAAFDEVEQQMLRVIRANISS